MSDTGDDDIKRTAARWLRHQPFLHVLLLSILGLVGWLAYSDKPQFIPDVLKVGCYSVVVTLIGVGASWVAPRIQTVVDSIPAMTTAYSHLVTALESQALSYAVLSRFVSATQIENVRNNKLVLLVEDSTVQAKLIRALCADIVAEFHLSFRDVGSLGEAFTYLQSACVAVIDVCLPDNQDPRAINVLIELAGCPVIVHSGTDFKKDDFPRAFAVLSKDSSGGYEELRDTMRRAVASTRFPT